MLAPPDIKAALIKKLVSKVKVKPRGVDIEYFVGEDYFTRELGAEASGFRPFFMSEDNPNLDSNQHSNLKIHPNSHSNPSRGSPNYFRGGCSNKLTVGARERT